MPKDTLNVAYVCLQRGLESSAALVYQSPFPTGQERTIEKGL